MSRTTRYSSCRSLKSENGSQSKAPANIPHQKTQCEQFIKLRSGSVGVNKLENKKSQIKDSTLQKKGVNYKTGSKLLISYERQKSVEKQKEKSEMIFTNCVFEDQQENSKEKYIQQIVKYLYRGKTAKEQYSQWGESQEETNGKRERVYKQKLRRRLIKSKRIEKEYKIKRNGDEKQTGKKTKILDNDYQMKMGGEKEKDKQIIKKLRSFAQKIEQIIHLCCSNVNQDVDRDNIQDFATIKTIQLIVNQVLKLIAHKRQTEDKKQAGETIEWSTSKQPIRRYYKYLRQQHLALFIKLVQIDLQPEYSKKSKQIFDQNKNHITKIIQVNKHKDMHKIKKIRQGHEQQMATKKQKYNQMGILRSEIQTQKMDSQSFLLDVLGNFEFVNFGNQDWIQELEE